MDRVDCLLQLTAEVPEFVDAAMADTPIARSAPV